MTKQLELEDRMGLLHADLLKFQEKVDRLIEEQERQKSKRGHGLFGARRHGPNRHKRNARRKYK